MTTSDRDLGEKLRAELARVAPLNPFEVLGLARDATGEDVRAAFLAATKQYHPNRFARESPEIVEAATELFLVIRRAYGQLTDDARRRALRRALSAQQAPVRTRPPGGLEAAPPPVSAPAAPPTQPPSPTAPAPTSARAPATQPPASTAPGASGRAPGTQPPRGPIPLGTGPGPAPVTPRPRPPVAGPPPATAPAISPTTGRSSAEVRAILESAKTRGARFEQACRYIVKKRLREARDLLNQLVTEDPHNRRYRAKLGLATALDLREQGQLDRALEELERAVVLDREAPDIAEALRKLQTERGRGGLFSKFFGR